MAEIRPLERDDLPAVSELLQTYLPGWPAEARLVDFLAATLIDHPWAEEDLPSLVAVDANGQPIGMIGSQVRRMRFDDRELRAVSPSHLVVAADDRAGAAGALLLRRLLTAGQDLTFSDQATDTVVRMWRTFGGHVDHARLCDWMLVLRPVRWLRLATTAAVRRRFEREIVPVGALPFQAGRRLAGRSLPEQPADVTGEDATAAAIVEQLPELTKGMRLRVDYDEQHLDHLFQQAGSFFSAPLTRRLVYRGDRPIGWYAYRPGPGGVSRVLHLTTTEADGDAALAELVSHARSKGRAVLTGRLEPHLAWPLRRRLAVMGFARQPVIHTRDPELAAVMGTSSSLVTQLDSEWFVNR